MAKRGGEDELIDERAELDSEAVIESERGTKGEHVLKTRPDTRLPQSRAGEQGP